MVILILHELTIKSIIALRVDSFQWTSGGANTANNCPGLIMQLSFAHLASFHQKGAHHFSGGTPFSCIGSFFHLCNT